MRKNKSPGCKSIEGPSCSLVQTAYGIVAVQPDDQQISESSGPFQQIHMAGMQNVITAVGKHDATTGTTRLFKTTQQFFPIGNDFGTDRK